jgi:hypothetical protein
VYVDDCYITGTQDAVNAAMDDIEKEHFATRRLGRMDEYIGCNVYVTGNGSCVLLQPNMIKKLERDFGTAATLVRKTTIPMGNCQTVLRPDEDAVLLSAEEQRKYRSGFGMLLYLVKHSRSDLCNAVRELAKVMDGATPEHMQLLLRAIKYVLTTKNRGLVTMRPTDEYKIEAYVDSDYAGDQQNRRSITGYMVYSSGVLIAWKSKQQGGVTLSSSEAEYYALSEVACELIFIKQIVELLEVNLELPMIARADNNGAIYLANNAISGSRTKHIDIRIHFVRYLTQNEPKILKTEFV